MYSLFIGSSVQGVIRIQVIEASQLIKADFGLMGKSKSDPYCKVIGTSTFSVNRILKSCLICETFQINFSAMMQIFIILTIVLKCYSCHFFLD